jgi:hypothetical protein
LRKQKQAGETDVSISEKDFSRKMLTDFYRFFRQKLTTPRKTTNYKPTTSTITPHVSRFPLRAFIQPSAFSLRPSIPHPPDTANALLSRLPGNFCMNARTSPLLKKTACPTIWDGSPKYFLQLSIVRTLLPNICAT